MADKQPSFSERRDNIARMSIMLRDFADGLQQFSVDLDEEAERMAAAEKRFSERKTRNAKASR